MMRMALAYFSFGQGLVVFIRSTLFGVVGDKIYVPIAL